MKKNFLDLIKKTKIMQESLKKVKKELSLIEVEGKSFSGLVKIYLTCRNKVNKIFIDPSLFKKDKDMLEDLIIIAFNDAINKAKLKSKEKINTITNGIKLPFDF
ncbi:YbaB/EbfC family nucleoid-associated protein [Candidatus Zinderia endosymbiont of Aphrophora alni]|uniref:YbaB/EbfC family nucleoid-associated protein n=1 Tax=Candidatus Zinderia endosymbiont of Aphrophora alni TaxID=3077951 RepID=UPI0030CECE2F